MQKQQTVEAKGIKLNTANLSSFKAMQKKNDTTINDSLDQDDSDITTLDTNQGDIQT